MSEKSNLMGRTLVKLNNARAGTRLKATDDIWARNGLSNPTIRDGYELREDKRVLPNGTEVVEYRLYKLIDATVVTISTRVVSEITEGVERLRETHDAKNTTG